MTAQHRPDGREQEDGMTDLTNFTDTSDVSDAAIEWVIDATNTGVTVSECRTLCSAGYSADRARIIAARLIQQHRSDLLVDPVDAIVREELAKAYEAQNRSHQARSIRSGDYEDVASLAAAKRLYLMGIEKGKGA